MFNRLFFGHGPLRVLLGEENGDAGGGSGGGGDGGSGGGGGGSVFTPEQQKALNAAISGHMQRLEKKIPTAESLTGSLSSLLEEKLKAFQPAGAGSGGGSGGSGGGSGGGQGGSGAPAVSPEVQTQLAKQASEIEKLRKEREEERKLREANEEKIRKNEERTELTAALRNGGVLDSMIKPLVTYLHSERGIVKRNEEGGLVMTVKRDWGEEDVPLMQGIAEWLKTDEGKSYLPPKEVNGSGVRGGSAPRLKAGEKPNRDQALDMLGNWMMGKGGEG